jgi:hypothetical protein
MIVATPSLAHTWRMVAESENSEVMEADAGDGQHSQIKAGKSTL